MVLIRTSLGTLAHSGSDFDFLAGSLDAGEDMICSGFSRENRDEKVTYSKGGQCVLLKTCFVDENLYWLLEDCRQARRTWLVAAGSNDLPELI